jgi:hypothetical protein
MTGCVLSNGSQGRMSTPSFMQFWFTLLETSCMKLDLPVGCRRGVHVSNISRIVDVNSDVSRQEQRSGKNNWRCGQVLSPPGVTSRNTDLIRLLLYCSCARTWFSCTKFDCDWSYCILLFKVSYRAHPECLNIVDFGRVLLYGCLSQRSLDRSQHRHYSDWATGCTTNLSWFYVRQERDIFAFSRNSRQALVSNGYRNYFPWRG